eukprot:1621945-Rhodomonas_salina.3
MMLLKPPPPSCVSATEWQGSQPGMRKVAFAMRYVRYTTGCAVSGTDIGYVLGRHTLDVMSGTDSGYAATR